MGEFENGCNNMTGISVTKLQPIKVVPAENTPREVLYLSNIDNLVHNRFTVQTLHVYCSCPTNHADPAQVIRHAISKALVYYYPLAGRMKKNADGKFELWCTGEGAVFVEGSANCSLEDIVGYLAQHAPCLKQLLYGYPATYEHHEIPPLVVQVTRFLCGGFVFGLGLSHCMIDGLGFSQFLYAVADLARGAPILSVAPEWKREILKPRRPPTVSFDHKELSGINPSRNSLINVTATGGAVSRSFLVTAESLDKLKKNVLASKKEDDKQYLYCSTFEALAAFVWKSRVKALQIPLDEEVRFYFAVNVRKMYTPPLPEGYYGNGFFGACVAVSAKVVREASLWDLVKMVKGEKARLTDEYLRSAIDFLELHGPKQENGPPTGTEFYLSDWSRMEYSLVDFGWGKAVDVTPVSFPVVDGCIFLLPPNTNTDDRRKNGIRVITCLPSGVMETFNSEMVMLDM